MERRQLLKLLALGMAGHALDVDKLLWVPGAKTFFIPELKRLSAAEIVAAELERIQPKLRMLFERDNEFYARISQLPPEVISSRDMRVPLIIAELDDD